MPVYNVREYLQGCIDSLLVQTYINLEILLVDDGSTDGSEVLCDRAALANDRVTVIHQKNGGQSSARNVGTLRAKGDWIVYVDSDDVVSPHFLEHLYNAAQLNESDMAICHGTVFAENGVFPVAESNHVTILDSANAVIELLSERRASTAPWGKLARSSFWKEFPFPEDRRFEDLAVTWKALNKANSVAFLEGSYYGYRNRLKSTSSFPQLKSIVDYETSIQQVWLELIPSSNRMLKAKCFRCCLEYCRLLEMISSLSDSRIFDKNVEQTLVNVRNHSVGFLRRYGAKALSNMAASFFQRFRIVITAIFPDTSISLMKLRNKN
ncbi:glycosyltransferase family 2 protein [Bifidobacterium mongoliense]|uniref:glycosyltransferase family 2 protein n=1 Tax=Bifidobacterium mongoliense TaxID=518643 RepID=UPI0030EF11F1